MADENMQACKGTCTIGHARVGRCPWADGVVPRLDMVEAFASALGGEDGFAVSMDASATIDKQARSSVLKGIGATAQIGTTAHPRTA